MPPPSIYDIDQTDGRKYSITQSNIIYSLALSNPLLYSIILFERPIKFEIQNITLDEESYNTEASVGCSVSVINKGMTGSQILYWQLIEDITETVISSGNQLAGPLEKWDIDSFNITGIISPDYKTSFKVRIKAGEGGQWVYSSVANTLPVDLSVTAVHTGSDIYWPGNAIACHVHVTNAGFSGSQTVEWQLINTATEEVLSSGSQSSGVIGDFASAQVDLTGIISPSGGEIEFKIRARITGSSTWIYSWQMANYINVQIPENPDPRGLPI